MIKNYLNLKWLLYSIIYILSSPLILMAQTERKDMNLNLNFECSEADLKITRFRDGGTNKNNKIVIGRPIEFKAKPTKGNNYQWGIGNINDDIFTPFWQFAPNTASGTATIPATVASMSMNNADFGAAHGNVKVTALIDEVADEASRDVEVFFQKDENSPHNAGVPNWFYYWSRIPEVIDNLTLLGIRFYQEDANTPANYILNPNLTPTVFSLEYGAGGFNLEVGNLYGDNGISSAPRGVFADLGEPNERFLLTELAANRLCITIYDSASKICGHRLNVNNGVIQSVDGTGSTGIECLWEVFQHELEHYRIFERFWQMGYSSRTVEGMDIDTDRDYYPRNFELQNMGHPYFFDPLMSDAYDASNYDSSNYVTNPDHIDPNVSAGTNYEEVICRMFTDNLQTNGIAPNQLNSSDWSFSQEANYQGKNW